MSRALIRKRRYNWLDVIKAIAMLLVIFGHLGLVGVKEYQVYASFIKLPLFFAGSGFVFNPKYTENVKEFIKSRIQRILLPYFYLCFFICIFNIFIDKKPFKEWLTESLESVFTGQIYMWFLPVLFLCNILMLFVFKIFKSKPVPIIIFAAACLVTGYFTLPENRIFFNVNETLIAFPFCVFGYYFKTYMMNMNRAIRDVSGLVCLVLYAVLPIVYKSVTGNFNYINMNENYYACFFLDILIAFCGTYGVFILVQFLVVPKYVVLFGQNTMFYYAFHIPMCSFIIVILNLFFKDVLTDEFLREHVLIYVLITVATILILALPCKLTNRYLPFIVGLKKQKPKKEEKTIDISKNV